MPNEKEPEQSDKPTVPPWVWLADRLSMHQAVQSVAANRFAYMVCLQCETDLHCSWQFYPAGPFTCDQEGRKR